MFCNPVNLMNLYEISLSVVAQHAVDEMHNTGWEPWLLKVAPSPSEMCPGGLAYPIRVQDNEQRC